MSANNRDIGILGENIASKYLSDLHYQILYRNYMTKSGEIDIIAKKANKISFFEVKTRTGVLHGLPHHAVDRRKIRHLNLAIEWFLLQNNFKNYKLSLDVISIILNDDETVNQIKLFENITL